MAIRLRTQTSRRVHIHTQAHRHSYTRTQYKFNSSCLCFIFGHFAYWNVQIKTMAPTIQCHWRLFAVITILNHLLASISCLAIPTQVDNAKQSNVKCGKSNQISPFLWKIDKEPPSYFFGTIHVPFNQVWPLLPPEVERVFQDTTDHYYELDTTDTLSLTEMVKCQFLPPNQQLEQILPASVMARLRKHLLYVRLEFESWMNWRHFLIGLQPDSFYRTLTMYWQRRRPIWIVILLQTLTKSGISNWGEPFLDMYLSSKSHRLGKKMGAIERVDEQCRVLNSIDLNYQIYALNETLDNLERMRNQSSIQNDSLSLKDMVEQYNCGNFSKMSFNPGSDWMGMLSSTNNKTDKSILKQEEQIKHELLHKRDRRMASRVMHLLNLYPSKSYFFAFGVAHFLGNESVLNLIQTSGFNVQRYTAISDTQFAYVNLSNLTNHNISDDN